MEETKFVCNRFPTLKIVVKSEGVVLKDGVPYPVRGKKIVFENGIFITDDKDMINRLRGHPWFGSHITEITPEDEERIRRNAKIEMRAKKIAQDEIEKEEAEEKSKKKKK